jgi:tetratricopeptide (TPR) repeat protein
MRIIINLLKPKTWICLWNYWLGLLAMVSHKYKRAIVHFNRCLNFEPTIGMSGLIYEQLGKCYFDTDEFSKAKTCLLKSLEIKPSTTTINSEISSRLGFLYYQEGDFEKAKYHLENALKTYNKKDYTNIGQVKNYLSELEEKHKI